jgi:anaerobic magnesium-protoporphyrin IX monomethyl ester cyclase
LAANGATSVFLGIESGSDTVLTRIGKRISTDQIRRGVRIVRESGIQLNLGFIMFEPDSTLAELEENYTFLEELGLLAEHELTANLLYHNQIVLHGSASWERFELEGRLLVDKCLPFEARYRFRDGRVGLVCSAMGRLTSHYFSSMDSIQKTRPAVIDDCGANRQADHFSGSDINILLKDAFQSLCRAANTPSPRQVVLRVEREYVTLLRDTLAV